MVPCSNHGRVIYVSPEISTISCDKTQDNGISQNFNNSENNSKNTLKSIYLLHKDKFREYIFQNKSKNYAREMSNTLDKIFTYEISELEDIHKLIKNDQIRKKSGNICIRVFCNYLEENNLLSDIELNIIRRKFKANIKSNIDTYIPTTKELNDCINLIIVNTKDGYHPFYREICLLYKLYIETGGRLSEIQQMVETFDNSKVEIIGDIVCYRNFYLRDTKNSYYLFFTKNTYNELFLTKKLTEKHFKTLLWVIKELKLVNIKYLRKYQFSLLIEKGVSLEVANFIQGRTSRDVGFNHYLAKKKIALKEYKKILTELSWIRVL